MDVGYTIDHVVESGKLITLFSAPDYPQFQATAERYKDKGAYIVLVPPHFDSPVFHSFEAVTPRPEANPYYDYEDVIDSDEELDFESMGKGSSWKISSPPNIEASHFAAEQPSMPDYHYPLHECHCLQNILRYTKLA
ncbi:hypothetical protein Vadar_032241 [Vaccinium darrowii]|uniref:Uncharacterized protein n=1 Tax=Vaccinium darrowii TaxID=229202 RepID=A0ACB7Y347_9ERIC|nr:hypothetical protein Vadar_032241 [Vaccinium darrowii]